MNNTSNKGSANGNVPVVLLSTADFDADVWTNKQHLAVGLAKSRRVLYVESLGLRAPNFSASDLRRIVSKLGFNRKTMAKSATQVPDNIEIFTPKLLPWHGVSFVAALNRSLLRRALKSKVKEYGNAVFWTFSPITYGLEQNFKNIVYHSVDLLHAFPGVPAKLLLEKERLLIPQASAVIASSKGVFEHLQLQGAEKVNLWENVAHVELFAAGTGPRDDSAIFAGNLTPTKIDFSLLEQIADRGVTLRLAGPIGIDGSVGRDQLDVLLSRPNVHYLGNLGLEQLATEVTRCQVGLIPYLLNEYTQGVYPMKVHEYLSAGLKVVSTKLPSLEGIGVQGLSVVSAEDFCQEVLSGLEEFSEAEASIRAQLSQANSWTARIIQATELLEVIEQTEIGK